MNLPSYKEYIKQILARISDERMVDLKFKVRVFLGDELIPEDKLKDVYINSPYVNKVVNAAVDRVIKAQQKS